MKNQDVTARVLAKNSYNLTEKQENVSTHRSVTRGITNKKFVPDSSNYIRYLKTIASFR
jgi:hypothetical protein